VIERLGFGAASIGNLYRAVSEEASREVLEVTWDGGVRSFDTAPHYGLGLSERRLGAFLADKPREAYRLSTKVGRLLVPNTAFAGGMDSEGFVVPDDLVRRFDPSADGIRRSLDHSLQRLGLDHVDTLLLHDPDVYDLDRGLRDGLPALAALRDEGVAHEVGVGVNSVDAAVRAIREGDIDVVMIAGRYTLLEQPAAETLLPEADARGVRVLAAAVFNSGLLAAADPSRSHYNYGDVPAELIARTEALREVCARHGVALPAAALQYPLRHPAVDQVVVGTARAAAIRENIAHMNAPIPDAFWREVAERGLAA
jgi:D-threo-aldose 1-dehydrogenase